MMHAETRASMAWVDAAAKLAPDMKLVSVPIPFDLSKLAPDRVPRIVAELKKPRALNISLVSFLIPYIFRSLDGTNLSTRDCWNGRASLVVFRCRGRGSNCQSSVQEEFDIILGPRGTGMITVVGGLPGTLAYDKLASALGSLQNPPDLA